MSIYKISDLMLRLSEMVQDGFFLTEITELPADEETPAALHFDALSSDDRVDYEDVDSIDETTDSKIAITVDDACASLAFSPEEICTLMNAVDNALEYANETLKSPDCSRSDRDAIKKGCVDLRNMQAKFAKFRKRYVL